MNNNVAVLMCTYNGEKYIEEQLESLLAQTYSFFTLFIHDDGSNDKTREILDEYEKKYSNIKVLDYKNPIHGAAYNFMSLIHKVLEKDQYNYFLFCDQDDVWNERKIEESINAMKGTSPDIPYLVYCDQCIVDGNLQCIYKSESEAMGYEPEDDSFKRIVFRNTAPGCCICINRALAKIIDDVDYSKILMHDWWIMLVASCCGEIRFINKPLIEYRQHSRNTLGFDNNNYLKKAGRYIKNGRSALTYRKQQAIGSKEQVFLLNESNVRKEYLDEIIRFKNNCKKSKLLRIYYLVKNKYIKSNNIFTYLFV